MVCFIHKLSQGIQLRKVTSDQAGHVKPLQLDCKNQF